MSLLSEQLKNQYFQSYIQNATNSVSSIGTVSQIPTDIPLETLIAITTYNPQIIPGSQLQKYTQNSQIVQQATALRLQQSGILLNNLSNFTPSVLSGNAIQRRTNGVIQPLNDRDRILRGLDPRTRQLVQQLEDLRALSELQTKLQRIIDKIENQITRFTAIFNALVNAPDAAVSATLTVLIAKLEDLEAAYTKAKAVYELVKKVYQNTKKAIAKALFKDIPKAKENLKKGLDALGKILKLPERPRIVLFPKFPKLPRLNWSKADFYNKYKKALETLKKKDGEFYQKAYSTAVQQAGFEIVDPNKDKIQRGLTQARNSLRNARAKFQASQAIRTEAVNRARNELINNIRNVSTTTERERLNILQQYQNARQRTTQIGSRRLYLNSTEVAQLLISSRVDITNKNILGDPPTGQITPDGRTVYKDRRNEKVYVLQSAKERVEQQINTSTAQLRNTVGEINTAVNTVNTAIIASAQLGASLNNKVLGAEFVSTLAQEAQTVNNITQQAREATNNPISGSEVITAVNASEFSVDSANKIVTTVARRLQPTTAINDATLSNSRKATSLGYSGLLTINATPPFGKSVNGQLLFEVTVTAQYASQSTTPSIQVNQAQLAELNRLVLQSITYTTSNQQQPTTLIPTTTPVPVTTPPTPAPTPVAAPVPATTPPTSSAAPVQGLTFQQQLQQLNQLIQTQYPDRAFATNETIGFRPNTITAITTRRGTLSNFNEARLAALRLAQNKAIELKLPSTPTRSVTTQPEQLSIKFNNTDISIVRFTITDVYEAPTVPPPTTGTADATQQGVISVNNSTFEITSFAIRQLQQTAVQAARELNRNAATSDGRNWTRTLDPERVVNEQVGNLQKVTITEKYRQ